MGLYDMIDKNRVSPGIGVAQGHATDFFDVAEASFDATMDNYRINSKTALIDEATSERDKKYKEITGRNILDDAMPFFTGVDTRLESEKANMPLSHNDKKVREAVDKLLDQSAKAGLFTGQEPLLNSEGIVKAAEDRARDSLARQQTTLAGATRGAGMAGNFVGGFGAMMFDPLNVASLPFGASASRSLLSTIFIEAGINAGVEVASQPFVKEWQNQIGEKYGFTDMAENVGMAAIFGAAIPAGAAGIGRAYRGGVHAFDTIKNKFKLHGKLEEAAAAEYMARTAHFETNKTPDTGISQRFDEAFPIDSHTRAMNETNAAVLEGRYINPEKVDTPIPRDTDDPSMKRTIDEFNEVFPDERPPDVSARMEARGQIVSRASDINPIFREEKPRAPDIEAQEKILELHKSPEAIKAEEDAFNDIETLPDDTVLEFDSDTTNPKAGEPTKTVGDYKREMLAEKEYLNAIRTCSL